MSDLGGLLNKVTQGDCLDVMGRIPDGSIDLVVTDPPYGINYYSNWSKDREYRESVKSVEGIRNDGADNIDFLSEVISELDRVLKDDRHLYWFTRWDRVHVHLPILEKHFKLKNAIIWKKNNWSMGDLQGAYAGQYEVILFAQKGRRILNEVDGRKRHPDILEYDRVPASRLRHSHEKPEELIEFLIQKSSNEGEIVLDPFAGSGTTAVCATKLCRGFITTELDGEYFEIAKRRIDEAITEKEVEESSEI